MPHRQTRGWLHCSGAVSLRPPCFGVHHASSCTCRLAAHTNAPPHHSHSTHIRGPACARPPTFFLSSMTFLQRSSV